MMLSIAFWRTANNNLWLSCRQGIFQISRKELDEFACRAQLHHSHPLAMAPPTA